MSNDRTPANDVAFTPTVKATQQCQSSPFLVRKSTDRGGSAIQ